MGVFATRSNFRPNPIGQSVVKLDSVDTSGKQIVLHLSGIDILDSTPVLDIKPYLLYSDNIKNAVSDFSDSAPDNKFDVSYRNTVSEYILKESNINGVLLRDFISELLSFENFPAYYDVKNKNHNFSCRIYDYDYDLKWRLENGKK